jgi:DnaJ-class molecular chaperone
MTRTIYCGFCGGSGYFQGTYGDIECIDCGGEGAWEEEDADEQLTECLPDPLPKRRAA